MAKKLYGSTGGLSNEVIKMYASVGGLSSNITKAYCSIGGLSKLFFGSGGGGEYSGFWFYNSTLAEKIIQGKRYTVVPTQVQVDINKRANGIAFYFFIQEIDSGSIIENLTIIVSTDENATPYNAVSQGQTDPYTNSTSIVVNNDTWYYTVGAPLDYDYFPTSPADMTPNCIVNNSIISSYYDVDDIVRGFLETYVYIDDFAEDYQVGQTYNLVGADIEKTVRKAIAIFLFKNAPLIANRNSYQLVLSNVETIVNHVLNDKGNYDKIHIVFTIPNDTDIWCTVYYSNDTVNNATLASEGYGYETAYKLFTFYNPTIHYYKYTQIRFLSSGSVTHQSASYTGVMTRTVGVAVTEDIQVYHGGHQVWLTNLGLKWGKDKTIYSTLYPNANVYNAGVVSTNNGTRSPIRKTNDGDAVVFCVKNCCGSDNWMGTFSIALSANAARILSPPGLDNTTSHTINGITYWISLQISNSNYGGATDITSPLNVPILQDFYVTPVNDSPTDAKVEELIELLGIQVRF